MHAMLETIDLANIDWRHDPAYQDAKRREDEAATTAATLDAEYKRLSREINAGTDMVRSFPPGHPGAVVQYQSIQADKAAAQATRQREAAEEAAKRALQQIGEDAGRAKWDEAEREVFPKLIQWCAEYASLRDEVLMRTGVTLPETTTAVCFTGTDLRTFMHHVRRELGVQR